MDLFVLYQEVRDRYQIRERSRHHCENREGYRERCQDAMGQDASKIITTRLTLSESERQGQLVVSFLSVTLPIQLSGLESSYP
jgi:hypothetical protein